MRLQSFLSQAGISSRRSVVDALASGKVQVNGEEVRIPSYPIFPGKDTVLFEGKVVKLSKNKSYFLFHKPKDVITTARDTHGRKTVLDFFKNAPERLYPVGRLDKDTTGLLIVTNDGDLTNRLTHPRFGVRKIYEATLQKKISKPQIEQLEKGILLEGIQTAPCEIRFLTPGEEGDKLEVTLHEGRKRQIRQMFLSLGFEVLTLYRKQYGPIKLEGLKPGEYRELTSTEVQALKAVSSKEAGRPENSNFRRPQTPKWRRPPGARDGRRDGNRNRNNRNNRARVPGRSGAVNQGGQGQAPQGEASINSEPNTTI